MLRDIRTLRAIRMRDFWLGELFSIKISYRSNEHDRIERRCRASQRFYIEIDWRTWGIVCADSDRRRTPE